MTIGYLGRGGKKWMYVCRGDQDHGAKACWTVSGMAIDAAVEELFLGMVIPAELDLTLAVEHEVEAQSTALHEQWKLRLEQAEYEARRAERRYMAVDPDNRTVARTLDTQWEAALQDLEQVRRRFDVAKRECRVELSAGDRARIRELARDLPRVWRARTTTPADRKAMLRIAIEAVSICPVEVPARKTHIQVQWRSAAVDELTIPRPGRGDHRRTPAQADAQLRELVARGLIDEEIAVELNRMGLETGARRPWNPRAVKGVRMRLGLKSEHQRLGRKHALPDQRSDGRYSVPGAARLFGVAESTVIRWAKCGAVKADREDFGQYYRVWWLTIDERCADRLRRANAQWQERRSTPSSKDTGDAL